MPISKLRENTLIPGSISKISNKFDSETALWKIL